VDFLESGTKISSRPASLAQRMRERTAGLHVQAERSGILAAIVSGHATTSDYALYLRNLHPAYHALEQALLRQRGRPGFSYLARPSLHRGEPIAADLEQLAGPSWRVVLPLLPAGERYAARVARAGSDGGELLIGHAYTRFLADLSGGQILRRCLVRLFGADFGATAFTEFPSIASIDEFAAGLRVALNEAGASVGDADHLVEEAAVAFEMNIEVSEEVATFCRHTSRGMPGATSGARQS
jgi:heme oxygenase (biliverdin-producing, ferredoxin)